MTTEASIAELVEPTQTFGRTAQPEPNRSSLID
jgi:hypothetical protein